MFKTGYEMSGYELSWYKMSWYELSRYEMSVALIGHIFMQMDTTYI